MKAQLAKSVHPYKTHRRNSLEPMLPSGLNHLTRKYIHITINDIKPQDINTKRIAVTCTFEWFHLSNLAVCYIPGTLVHLI
jgi:hypothetical protein